MKILVIGGTRFVGPYVIKLLVDHGHEVTMFNRGTSKYAPPKSVKIIHGNRDVGFKIKDHFDAVIDMCAYTATQVQQVIDGLSFDFMTHFGSVASYKLSQIFPITEDFPLGEYPSMGEYGVGKCEAEIVLSKSGIKYATVRATYVLGPDNYCDREHFIYSKIKNGETIVIPGNGQCLNTFVFADEVAKALVLLTETKTTGAFNCSGSDYVTLTGLVEMMGKIMEITPVIKYNPAADGANQIESEFPFSNENMVFTNDKIKTLGISFVTLFDGLKRDYEGFYKNII